MYTSQSVKLKLNQSMLVARAGSEKGQEVGTSATFSPAAGDRVGTSAGSIAW